MTNTDARESARARLIANEAMSFDNNILENIVKASAKAFNLPAGQTDDVADDQITHVAGPIQIIVATDADGLWLDITVTRLRESEALHPEAEVAILAEVISLLAEEIGGDRVQWAEEGITIDIARFVGAFIPLHRRGGTLRVSPRRIHRGDLKGTPIMFDTPAPLPELPPLEDDSEIRAIFAMPETEEPAKSGLTQVSTWAATASVGAMNPLIGVPLAAYNLTRGSDIRVTTHAFALTATLSGLMGTSLGYLPFF
jgi:hypothetical protein